MILEVLANVRSVQETRNASGLQFPSWSDARQHIASEESQWLLRQYDFLASIYYLDITGRVRYSTPVAVSLSASSRGSHAWPERLL